MNKDFPLKMPKGETSQNKIIIFMKIEKTYNLNKYWLMLKLKENVVADL